MKKLIAQGAEARIYEDNNIIKDRFPKLYRHQELDIKIRKFRTKREAKVLNKLAGVVPVPRVIKQIDTQLTIEKIDGQLLRDSKDLLIYFEELARIIAVMHNYQVIHGDLTTSNIITNKDRIYLIDFGLSFFSNKSEDKAVDLHLLYHALESKHNEIHIQAWKKIINSYKMHSDNAAEILKKLDQVEKRGRNKAK